MNTAAQSPPGGIETRAAQEVYEERRAHWHSRMQAALRHDGQFSNWRAVIFLIGLGLLAGAVVFPSLRGAWLGAPFAVFAVLVALHERLHQRVQAMRRRITYYDGCLARLHGNCVGSGRRTPSHADADHPYAADLDIFGPNSLFERLCVARTAAGEQTLADWLLRPRPRDRLQEARGAVLDLRGRVALREDLALLGEDVREAVHPEILSQWANAPAAMPHRAWRWVAAMLSAANVACILGVGSGHLTIAAAPICLMLTIVLKRFLQEPVAAVGGAVSKTDAELRVVSAVAARLHAEPFEDAALRRLGALLGANGRPAARCIARLSRLTALQDSYRNQMFWPIGFVLLWDVHFAFAIEAWRTSVGRRVPEWLAAIGELEALSSLGSFAFENPDCTYAEIVDEGPCLHGEGLGHPLLPEADCIRNDVSLDPERQVLMVSGSNMSGKSTLLRTVGVNAVLALAGAPVRAQRLRLSPLCLGATLRVQDSLAKGASRFYAEITRLKQIMDLAGKQPPCLLFLLDEILHGTNSHDRRVGAEAVVRGLMARGAIGLVTTHDLALAEATTGLGNTASNVHFVDHLEDGKLVFDYRLRPGVVQKSNAVALMRAVGLEV